jgi:hypothetical protein
MTASSGVHSKEVQEQHMITIEDVENDIALWSTQLRDALKLRNSIQYRGGDVCAVNSQIGKLVKLLRCADAEYIASALIAHLSS